MTSSSTTIAPAVGISISESADLYALGLSDGHLRDATARIALCLLAAGNSLAYGGDLRKQGLVEVLTELKIRYKNHPRHDSTVAITEYLAWPVHIGMTSKELKELAIKYESAASIVYLGLDGTRLNMEQRNKLLMRKPLEDEWLKRLTAMRKVILKETQARIVLGGKIEGYKGVMPRIAEETLLSLTSGQPVFVIGGFGGCARNIAEAMGLVGHRTGMQKDWAGRRQFCKFSAKDLQNGLTKSENQVLATTPHIREAVALIAKGMHRIRSRPRIGSYESDSSHRQPIE